MQPPEKWLVCLVVLIETLWNVKVFNHLSCSVRTFVLIETLWNVKFTGITRDGTPFIVLIETLWNVKLTSTGYVRREAKY